MDLWGVGAIVVIHWYNYFSLCEETLLYMCIAGKIGKVLIIYLGNRRFCRNHQN